LFDKGISSYRLGIDPEYKATRQARKGERTEEENEKWEHFFECQQNAMERISEAGIPVICEYGIEADDWMAELCRTYYDDYDEIKIITTDKDMLQLLDDKITIFAFVQREERDIAWLAEKYECTPEQFLRALILSGDTSDNIIGIRGVGEPVKSTSRSLQWARKGESLQVVIDIASTTKGIIAQRIADGAETIMLAQKLIDLNYAQVIPSDVRSRVISEIENIYGINQN
jgi:DNA polymerase-1